MNKTTHINLGGKAITIDQSAYTKLNAYISTLEEHYLKECDGREIMNDIENRIAEIFIEYLERRHEEVVTLSDVEAAISAMGQPNDIIDDEDPETSQNNRKGNEISRNIRKLYRDPCSRVLGGVASGLGHYLGISPIIIRLVFILLMFAYGSTVIIYIILWIVIPKAVTTQQRMEMRGEPINISNIEHNIKKNLNNIKRQTGEVADKTEKAARDFAKKAEETSKNFVRKTGYYISENGNSCIKSAGSIVLTVISWIFLIAGIIALGGIVWASFMFLPEYLHTSQCREYGLTTVILGLITGIFPIIMMIYFPLHHLFGLNGGWKIFFISFVLWIFLIFSSLLSAATYKIRRERNVRPEKTDFPDNEHSVIPDFYDLAEALKAPQRSYGGIQKQPHISKIPNRNTRFQHAVPSYTNVKSEYPNLWIVPFFNQSHNVPLAGKLLHFF